MTFPAQNLITANYPGNVQDFDPQDTYVSRFMLANSPSKLQRMVQRYSPKFNPGKSNLIVTSDSYGVGTGSSSTPKSYGGLISAEFANYFNYINYGFGGRSMTSYLLSNGASGSLPLLCTTQSKVDDIYFGTICLNDLRGVGTLNGASTTGAGPDPANHPQFRRRLKAFVSRLLIPETSRVRAKTLDNSATNPLVTYAGTWNTGGIGGSANVVYSTSTNTSTAATLTRTYGDLMFIRFMSASGASCVYSVTIDGAIVGYITSKSNYDTNWAYDCAQFKVPLSTHNVVLTWVSGDNIVLYSVDCVDTSTDFGGQLIYSTPGYLNITAGTGWDNTMTANSSITNSTIPAYLLNNGGADRMALVINSVMDELYELGFNVLDVCHRSTFDPVFMISADNIHPNDFGHADIYMKFRHPLRALVGL